MSNAENDRIKHRYCDWMRDADGKSEASIDQVLRSLALFEEHTKGKSFKLFKVDQARTFREAISARKSKKSGSLLSVTTVHGHLENLRRFFVWLSGQPGFKSRMKTSDAQYFRLSRKDARVARAHRFNRAPTPEQIVHVLKKMPTDNEIALRNRAVIAFTLLTGCRDSATASLQLGDVDVIDRTVFQDARHVRTKNSKTMFTAFFPVPEICLQVVTEWVAFLREEKLFSGSDPLFPRTRLVVSDEKKFSRAGLEPVPWKTAGSIRTIFKKAFEDAGIEYFNPHSFRNALAVMATKICKTPEELKAWSQNLGHEKVLTTLYSYGGVNPDRQFEIMATLARRRR